MIVNETSWFIKNWLEIDICACDIAVVSQHLGHLHLSSVQEVNLVHSICDFVNNICCGATNMKGGFFQTSYTILLYCK